MEQQPSWMRSPCALTSSQHAVLVALAFPMVMFFSSIKFNMQAIILYYHLPVKPSRFHCVDFVLQQLHLEGKAHRVLCLIISAYCFALVWCRLKPKFLSPIKDLSNFDLFSGSCQRISGAFRLGLIYIYIYYLNSCCVLISNQYT